MVSQRTREAVLGKGATLPEDQPISGTDRSGDRMPPEPQTGPPADGPDTRPDGPAAGEVEPWVVSPRDIMAADDAMGSLAQWVADHAAASDEDNAAVMAGMVARILHGETAEDVLREELPLQGEKFADRVFLLHGFRLNESEFAEGIGFYASLDAQINPAGERRTINCGGIKVLAKLMMLERIGEWPQRVKITAKRTRGGNTVLDLVAAQ